MRYANLERRLFTERPRANNMRVMVRDAEPKLYARLDTKDFARFLYTALGKKPGRCIVCNDRTKFLSLYKGHSKFCSPLCSKTHRGTLIPDRGRPRRPRLFELERLFVRTASTADLFNRAMRSKHAGAIRRAAERLKVTPGLVVYHMFVSSKIPSCPTCGDPPSFRKLQRGYATFCCVDCANTDAAKQLTYARQRATNVERHGVENPFQLDAVKVKTRRTHMRKYGVSHSSKDPGVRAKMSATMMDHFGCEYAVQSPEVNAKRVATSLRHYGVRHPMQDGAVAQSAFDNMRRVKHVRVAGRSFMHHGFEHFLIRHLAKSVDVRRIANTVADMPRIWYRHEGRRRRYYPDVRVGNTLYEVKSAWTLGLRGDNEANRARFDLVQRKADACEAAGFRFKCALFSRKGVLLYCGPLDREWEHYRHLAA